MSAPSPIDSSDASRVAAVPAQPSLGRFDTSGRYPSPRLTRWGITWRYGLLVLNLLGALGALSLVATPAASTALGTRVTLWGTMGDLVLGIGSVFLIRYRRVRPLTVLLVLCLMSTVSTTTALAATWAYISLATRRRWYPIALGTLAMLTSQAFSVWYTYPNASIEMTDPIILGLLLAVSTAAELAFGLFVGARRDLVAEMRQRAEDAERQQEVRVLQGQAHERNRIAREMHDVLAHRLSLVSMHAGALAFRDDLTPVETRDIARTIQENAHISLTELRGVLGSLREDSAGIAVIEKPQPQLLALDDLVAEARAAGTRLEFDDEIEHPELLPTLTARHGYRIIQEALTNARKHAPNCRVQLRVWGAPGQGLGIIASNKMPMARADTVPGSKVGLVGLRERVDVTGGRMTVRQDDGQFELEVWLPW